MGLLTGPEIEKQIHAGRIIIDPFDPKRVNPNSVNLTLHPKLFVYEKMWHAHEAAGQTSTADSPLDMRKKEALRELNIPDDGLIIYPNVLYLGSTNEHTETDHYAPRLDGRSSIGRLGMFIHVTAAWGDVGYCGRWTLEIMTVHPLRIYANTAVCQISYEEVVGDRRLYQGKYQNAEGVRESRLHCDFAG